MGGNYSPEPIFNMDETSLLWNLMPENFICREARAVPGFKDFKDEYHCCLGETAGFLPSKHEAEVKTDATIKKEK
jgi:hypothetical protein